MKSILKFCICCITVICILLSVGCSTPEQDKGPDPTPSTVPKYFKTMEEQISLAEEGKYHLNDDLYVMDARCLPADPRLSGDFLFDYVNVAVKATYRTAKRMNGYYLLCFDLVETVRGEKMSEQFYVIENSRLKYECCDFAQIRYERNKSYLLLLKKYVNPTFYGNYYSFALRSAVIPLSILGEADMENATMCTTSFSEAFEDPALKSACDNGKFEEWLLNRIGDNPEKQPTRCEGKFVESIDIKETVESSEYIWVAKISFSGHTSYISPFSVEAKVTLIEAIKNGKNEKTEFFIDAPRYSFNEGDEIIVMFNVTETEYGALSELSSWNSIHPLSMKEEIIKILNEVQ